MTYVSYSFAKNKLTLKIDYISDKRKLSKFSHSGNCYHVMFID